MKNQSQKVIVGMSGGVDSSVAALLLLQQGYRVEGLFMKNWEQELGQEDNCAADQDLIDAQAVCLNLGIRLHTVNFADEYWDKVFEYFLEEYRRGRTPNPDIVCNKEIKFRAFLDYALELGADYIATGHYARIKQENGYSILCKGRDNNKDQSYFLYALTQEQLQRSLFPLGELEKSTVRQTAEKRGFRNHAKKDSTGICFIGERKFNQFLGQYLPAKEGEIINDKGELMGRHQGLMFHTIGQRQGLGIGGQAQHENLPWYVLDKNLTDNRLIIGQGNNHPALFKNNLLAEQLSWISGQAPTAPFHCRAKTRYRQQDQDCTIQTLDSHQAHIQFQQAQRAITPGQSIVFYQEDSCLGGGVISNGFYEPDPS